MQLPESRVPESLPPELNWRRVKVSAGIKHAMILAGAPFGCDTHHPRRRTLPCLTRLPGCSIPCPICAFARRFTVWVPLIDPKASKQKRIVIQGGKRTWESLDGKQPGDVVCFARGNEERSTILFTSVNEQSINSGTLHTWRAQIPFDVRPWCFHLWQWRELSEHFGLKFYPSIRTEEIEKRFRTTDDDPPRKPDV